MKEELFRKNSLDKVTSPEQLDELIRVANPSLWVALGAVIILLGAVLGWSIFGALPTTLSTSGVAAKGNLTFYLSAEDAKEVVSGMPVHVGGEEGTVIEVGALPLSQSEVTAALGSDYLAQSMSLSEWNIPVTAAVSGVADGPCEVKVTVDSIQPIRFILN